MGTFQTQRTSSRLLEIRSCSSTFFLSPVLPTCLLNYIVHLNLGASTGRIDFVCVPGPDDSKWVLGSVSGILCSQCIL